MMEESVVRVVRRRAKWGCAPAYEALARAMDDDARRFPGYLSAGLIPPENPEGEYQLVERFRTETDMKRWHASAACLSWLEKIAAVAEGEPGYRLLHGLDVWFGPADVPVAKTPPRWRMTVLSWLAVFPTVVLLISFAAPLLKPFPFLLKTAVTTALGSLLMSYLVMPRLTRWLGWWLRSGNRC